MASKKKSDIEKEIGAVESKALDASEKVKQYEAQALKSQQVFENLAQAATSETDQAITLAALESDQAIDNQKQIASDSLEQASSELTQYQTDLQSAIANDRADIIGLSSLEAQAKVLDVNTQALSVARVSKQVEIDFLTTQSDRINDIQRQIKLPESGPSLDKAVHTHDAKRTSQNFSQPSLSLEQAAKETSAESSNGSDSIDTTDTLYQNIPPNLNSPQKVRAYVDEVLDIAFKCYENAIAMITILTSPTMSMMLTGSYLTRTLPPPNRTFEIVKSFVDVVNLPEKIFPQSEENKGNAVEQEVDTEALEVCSESEQNREFDKKSEEQLADHYESEQTNKFERNYRNNKKKKKGKK